jgi:hypothetical protein
MRDSRHRHEGCAVLDRGHHPDQDAGDFFLFERFDESAKRADWRLIRHRSSGVLEK